MKEPMHNKIQICKGIGMGILYYYTTAETMKFILTNGDIFATNISYLNDSEEYVNGLRELQEVFLHKNLFEKGGEAYQEAGDEYKRISHERPEIYSISFSQEADLLSQWFMYAKESGVRLGMLFPQEKQEFEIKKKFRPDERRAVEATLRNVHYFTRIGMPSAEYGAELTSIEQMVDDYAQELEVADDMEANVIRIWKEIAPYIKNYEFRQEKEVRLIFSALIGEKDNPNADLIEYRNANGVLVPYLDVYRKEGWPVVEIMVGPGRNQKRVFDSICHFVDNNILKIPQINQAESMRCFMEGMSSYQVGQEQIEKYCSEIEKNVREGQGIITYNSQIYDILKNKEDHERDYLDRNYYSNCGIIVRKSNAPYVFS